MKTSLTIGLLFQYLWLFVLGGEQLSPFKDDILYHINWAGSNVNLQQFQTPGTEYNSEDTIIMTSANNEKYSCTLPSKVSAEKSSDGSTEISMSPVRGLSGLFKSGQCKYYYEPFWTYEICHGKHIKQYHEERVNSGKGEPTKIVLQTESGYKIQLQSDDSKGDIIKTTEFYLGTLDGKVDEEGMLIGVEDVAPTSKEEVPTRNTAGVKTPYYAVVMDGGTACDLRPGVNRQTTVYYICGPESNNDILSVTETSSCEYEVVVLSPQMCNLPLYNVERKQVHEIQCIAVDDAPAKPVALKLQLEEEAPDNSRVRKIFRPLTQNDDEPKQDDLRRVEVQKISTLVDKSLLNEFLSGSYCLRGGTGWWRFEFCYGKHVHQYHDDAKLGRTTISVGTWNKQEHKEWAKLKTSKPRTFMKDEQGDTRVSMVQHFYGHGDVCEETGKPRQVVVRMKCKKSPASSHAVSIYLLEPSKCVYILGVESAIVCGLLDSADAEGMLKHEP
uniref:endoplasmic reticulum lectin 1 n=1 Tax=Ciona intestinalis TaxID=7719 RepID=UPI000180B53D|nr:endoplasmic reticulum lectin 1 [Ciona intestinalis]|eukprot:XP_002125012.1 endoplasmic reticulum lectin 1 [Ciona intestinalis]